MKKSTGERRIKTNGYSHDKLDAKRARKRTEAERRNARWAALSPQDKIDELVERPGESKRQFARLHKNKVA